MGVVPSRDKHSTLLAPSFILGTQPHESFYYHRQQSLIHRMLTEFVDEAVFHQFSKFPTELGEEIWSYCLPHRGCELDVPWDDAIFATIDNIEGPWPCTLRSTTYMNSRPPVITRVC